MSASGFSVDSGFSVANIYEGELKRRILERSNKVVMLMDLSKVGRNMPFTYAKLDDIDVWVCEKRPSKEIEEAAIKKGVTIVCE